MDTQVHSTSPYAPERNSTMFVLQSTAVAGLTGSTLGAIFAAVRGQSRLAWAFSMGTNWVLAFAPFFGIREAVLHYRYQKNAAEGVDSFRMRDKDELISSITSGAIVGAGMGLIWRGPRALLSGSLMYSLLACGGQTLYLVGRQWRLRTALQQRIDNQSPIPDRDQGFSLSRFWQMEILRPDPSAKPAPAAEIDPVGSLFVWARDKINANVDLPDWTSPLLNAWDIEYRKRLNIRLKILESQVGELRETVGTLRKDVGEDNVR
ncbi:uncharacterized protein SPPG_04696 [Spizellomyces punctatus DAOM BR117]|uniref:Uncharacterized protein n=1 Tax=Spizellomyces punctatus (strain DAOM BR117) TaxID=645134 RepID=A0A0L0HH20_SPIPD|nr:uncharacterized protein SPPG_04696 [Spizellomyces punctatus DAOM BR117]KND00372.1 hypothetical protein SPPG_04696 [Spizellomyces punctatus DAOM BR117]|eukprot:XP_016608411.1 hypothetical protein SPPG_04696 [Spizellomyces punctatus DAOM BR117]